MIMDMSSTSHLGSTHSSPESFDDDTGMMGTANWQHMPPPVQTAPPSVAGSSTTSSAPTKVPLPLQKRRRVTRACDECRRKKIKCDGKQPCTHCTVYSYDCTYDQPSNRRRNPAPQYIEALENRLQRTEALLKAVLPDVDVNHPNFSLNKFLPQIQQAAADRQAGGLNGNSNCSRSCDSLREDSLLESMVEAAGRLEIDEAGHMDFHGHSSGVAFLAHINNQFGNLLGGDSAELKKMRSTAFPAVFESPGSSASSPPDAGSQSTALLPSREIARVLIDTCLDDACVLMRFVHRPTFNDMVDRVYSMDPGAFGEAENSFLPLLFLSLAVGCLFVNDMSVWGIENPVAEGNKYFGAGRRMVEITDCRDIHSIQAVIMMVIFLQSSVRMSTCYSFVGIALSAAVRLGLHRALPETRFDPIEREVRKRIFWTVKKMDTYVGALLGLPKGIADEDIDQDMPAEVDDEFITREEILAQPEGVVPAIAAANAHTRLLAVMGKVVKYIYPLEGVEASATGKLGYSVSYSKVHEIENDLGRWQDDLPMQLRLGGDTSESVLKAQFLLQMAFAHVQMMLYRPFVHYISRPKSKGSDERPYASAAACVDVSRRIVHIADEMRKRGVLIGAYWFTMYTTFFSVIALLYYVLENPTDVASLAILGDAETGRDVLSSLKDKSLAAKRCTMALLPLFEKLPERIRPDLEKANLVKRKRARAGSKPTTDSDKSGTWSSPSRTVSPEVPEPPPNRRSKTFPGAQSTPIQPQRKLALNQTPDDPSRRGTYEVYTTTVFPPTQVTPDSQQPLPFQAHLSGSGLPDLNALMFPSPDTCNYNYAQALGQRQQQYPKQEYPKQEYPKQEYPKQEYPKQEYPKQPDAMQQSSSSSPESIFGASGSQGNPYDSLEVQLFGPLPPYLLQGQAETIPTGRATEGSERPGIQPLGANGNNRTIPTSMTGQNFMVGNTGGAMNLDSFFGEEYEWDDMLLPSSSFRMQDVKEF